MLGDDRAVLGLCGLSQIEDRPTQPAVSRLPEPELRLRCDALTSSSPSSEVIPKLPRRQDATVDGPPALATGLVLEANLEHARRRR